MTTVSNFKATVFYVSLFTSAIIVYVLGRNQFDSTPVWLYTLATVAFMTAAWLLIDAAKDRKGTVALASDRAEPILEEGIMRTHHEAIWRAHLSTYYPNHIVWSAGQGILIAMQGGEPIGAADIEVKNFWAIDPKG